MTVDTDVGSWLRAEREQRHVSIGQLSRATGLSKSLISKIEHGHRVPSRDSATRIDRELALAGELIVRAGYVAGRGELEADRARAEQAIREDRGLSDADKQVLVSLYRHIRDGVAEVGR